MPIVSRRFAQGAVLVIVLGLSAVLAAGIWKGRIQNEKQAATAAKPSDAEMKLTDMDYTEMEGGNRIWTLNSSEAKYYQKQQKSLLTNVRLTFFLKDGEEVVLKSGEGVLYAGTKNIELWDNVHADLPRGYQLVTDRVFYDHQSRTVSSETPVHLVGPEVQLDGVKWKYIIPEYRAIVEGGVQATVVSLYIGSSPKR
jgi:LPS export ABC transporter protein LptC